MKELVIVSGKGGTGKTSIAAALTTLATNHVVADCDVDAPNLHLLLTPRVEHTEEFVVAKLASIDSERCTQCGACKTACRFGAINEEFQVDPILCEGCGVCPLVCPAEAIQLEDRLSGYVYTSETDYAPMAHALLLAGESNSGKLVTIVRKKAHELAKNQGKDLVLVDGPPGIACPTIAAITGATAGLIVAEPTVPAIHDMERTLQLFAHFQIPALVVINKCDLNVTKTEMIESYCSEQGVLVVGKIPYDSVMTKAIVAGESVVAYNPQHEISQTLQTIWTTVKQQLTLHHPP